MKRLIYGSLFLATIGISVLACKKEAMSPVGSISSAKNTTITQKQKGGLNSASEKTRNLSLDSIAQAADLSKITYISSNDSYLIESYDDTLKYGVQIQDFFIDSLMKFTLKLKGSTNVYNVKIDVKLNTIVISGIGSYTFSNYYDSYGVTATSGRIKNMVAVFTVYYALFPNTTTTWSDNGDGDVYHPATRRFWGWDVVKGDCNEFLHEYTEHHHYYVFWFEVQSSYYGVQKPC